MLASEAQDRGRKEIEKKDIFNDII